jgi:hypothetical protein
MRRREEEGAKVKLLNCFVLAIVLLSVSALSGVVVCAAEEHPSGPDPTEITVTVNPQSIPADETAMSTITACAMDNSEASGGRRLTFIIDEGPDDVVLIPELEAERHTDIAVYNITNENGYAYAKLKAGTTEGQVTIKVYWGAVSDTKVVTVGKGQPVNNKTNFTIEFVTGYNMISLPVNDSAVTDASSFAAKIGNNCTEIIKWNSAIQEYVTYLPGVPLNNFDVSGGEGYLANINKPMSTMFTGESWESPFTVSMVTGYNMISLPVNDSAVTDASTFADKIGDNCTEIIKWDSAIQEYVTYLPGVPLNNFDVTVGEGYLANVNHPTDVTFN